jgi:ACS family tartrate transporter-like MFS transporter
MIRLALSSGFRWSPQSFIAARISSQLGKVRLIDIHPTLSYSHHTNLWVNRQDVQMTAADIHTDNAVYARIRRKLLPFLFLLYVVAYLDRINVGFAALQMNRQLGLSEAVFGFGAGIFFIGYFLLEIPSNLVLQRVGARVWISRIMVSWGVVAIAMMFTRGAKSFYLLRFLLGAAEAGFFPGIIFYLTYWFPSQERARAVSLFMTATQIAGVIGGPLSGVLLSMNGAWHLAGWQWLFLAEGIPAVILGAATAIYLPDTPERARWLNSDERKIIAARLELERESRRSSHTLSAALASGNVWLLALLYFTLVFGHYGIAIWLPQILKGFGGISDLRVGILSSLPFMTAAIVMVMVAKHSDSIEERRWHLASSALAGAIALTASAAAGRPWISLLTIAIAAAGVSSTAGPFWTFPAAFLEGTAAAGGIALINSTGNLAGFVGPSIVGLIRQITGSFAGGLLAMALAAVIASIIALAMPEVELRQARKKEFDEVLTESS